MPVTLPNAPPRDQAIVDLLRLYRDLEGVSASGDVGSRISGSADRELYRPGGPWDNTGCDILDDLLSRLRGERPVQWWHLTERYLRCDSRPRRVKVERTKSGNRRLPKPGPHSEYLGQGVRPTDSWLAGELLVVVESWSPQVRLEKVRHAVNWLAKRFPWDDPRVQRRNTDLPVAA